MHVFLKFALLAFVCSMISLGCFGVGPRIVYGKEQLRQFDLQFKVQTFNTQRLTYVFSLHITGDARGLKFASSPIRPPGKGSSISYVRDSIEYVPSMNATILTLTQETEFTATHETFPYDSYYFDLLFTINGTYSGFEGIGRPIISPSPNYDANIAVSSARSNVLTNETARKVNMPNFGSVYDVQVWLMHSADFQNNSSYLLIWTPILFGGLLLSLIGVLILNTLHSSCGIGKRVLEDSSFFTIIVSVIVFLPIYSLAIRELQAPLESTPVTENLGLLTLMYVSLLIVTLVVRMLPGISNLVKTLKSRKQERSLYFVYPTKQFKGFLRQDSGGQGGGSKLVARSNGNTRLFHWKQYAEF